MAKESVVNQMDLKDLKMAARVFRAVNHPLRLSIIRLIEENEKLTVTQIYYKLKIEQSVASQHLAILREAECLTATRSGKNIFYNVNEARCNSVVSCLGLLKA